MVYSEILQWIELDWNNPSQRQHHVPNTPVIPHPPFLPFGLGETYCLKMFENVYNEA